jgi:FMN phosphatase YigB (HAD superfamily)
LRKQCRLGILSNTGRETLPTIQRVLADAGILDFFETSLQLFSSVEGVDKTTVEIFHRALTRAGVPASRCVYISENDAERKLASTAGMHASYHPLHVFHVIETLGS